MSEITDPPGGEPAPAALPSVGSRLRLGREAKGLSVADASKALKLGPGQVEALESDNWQALPGTTFIRGFVRNYARLLELDATELMALLDSELSAEKPELVVPELSRSSMPEPPTRPQRRDYALAFVGLALVVVAILIYLFLPNDLSRVQETANALIARFSHPAPSAPASSPPQQPQPQVSEPVLPPGSSLPQVMNPQSAANEPSPNSQVTEPQAAPPAGNGGTVGSGAGGGGGGQAVTAAPLHLSFAKESWVEVRDRRGNVVFSQTASAGTEKDIAGEAPFSLIVGNSSGVKVTFRGQAVNLVPHTRGEVARLTLE